jgi:hypothetical protein
MATKNENSNINTLGRGMDIGTMNLISARRDSDGTIKTKRMRDVFIDLPKNSKKMLRLSNTSFVEREDDVLILGDAALETANIFGQNPRRPLSQGIVSSSEMDSLEVLGILIKNVLGDPLVPGEACYFSVPASPIDVPGRDVIYHRNVFEKIIRECGYTPYAANEAMAIIYSETAKEQFSGIGISAGSGMINVALAVNTIEGLTFSLARSGDWLDNSVASSLGMTPSRVCAIKESGVDLLNPVDRTQEALVFYYKDLINYTLDHIAAQFKKIEGQFALQKAIPIVISGGTSMAGGFLKLFTDEFEKRRKKFPIQISEIRSAQDPLNAVAFGLLIQAMQEE